MSKISFEEAKAGGFKERERYIAYLNLGDHAKYVNKIDYTFKIGDAKTLMETHPKINHIFRASLGFRKSLSDILIYPKAFDSELVQLEDDFLATFDHELRHTEQIYEKPRGIFPNPAKIVWGLLRQKEIESHSMELDAYRYEMNRINDGVRNVSPKMLKFIEDRIKFHENKLNGKGKK